MGQVLHGSARPTAAVRRVIQQSQASLNKLAESYGINPKTVAKWKKHDSVQDAPMGPKERRSTVLTPGGEAACVGRFADTRCCRWMIACMPCKPAFHT